MENKTLRTKPTHALIDADIIAYACSFAGEDRKTETIHSFERVGDKIEKSIAEVMDATGCTSYQLYLSGKTNFRYDVATTKPYKGNRKDAKKPYHLPNARAYLEGLGAVISLGMEADDLLALAQTEETVICSIDKDLLQCQGWAYKWESFNSPEKSLHYVDKLGYIKAIDNGKDWGKVYGEGLAFFYYQLVIGDSTDNIQGIFRKGPAFAYNLLRDLETEKEMFEAVREAYDDDELMLEQGRLLWMTRELHEDGTPILWEFPTWQ